MQEILRFHPVYQQRVWGGRAIETTFNRQLPAGEVIGESWEIVDRPEAQSVVTSGPHAGKTLGALVKTHAAELLGPQWPAERPFPMLVKWLDCRERLSLQVHPPEAQARELGGEVKTENWYIADTAPGAELTVGLKKGVTREAFERAIIEQRVDDCVHTFRVAEGDSILVHSGQVHAIGPGNLILEIQQNSDSTYRVYDWGRVGLDGRPRELHVHESLKCIQWDDFEPEPVRAAPTSEVIADCDAFRIRRVVLGPGDKLHFRAREQPRILSVVSGKLRIGTAELVRGDNAILPYSGEFSGEAEEFGIVLVTDNFAGAA
ncbi:mannose-6-phosphate isomerase [Cephaloticoccus primus]|uniref:Mannose-6-phosphate isomerase n=1 Tax=Cephaloticoccus primus TaxID=1548207 RepID=A0A139SHV8_9BACT|nr:type I phosphomannose isomerase catalytic subunit [Cephaloticoccus primus]KXU34158.1 mannose-6-phosphate isomerase [Cephaloticoccus primus]